jgi:hypothetical protein
MTATPVACQALAMIITRVLPGQVSSHPWANESSPSVVSTWLTAPSVVSMKFQTTATAEPDSA